VSGARATPPSLRLERGGCVIGAGPQSDIIIEDASVSRSHAALELVPEGVQLRDLGSRNGTYYLGQRVESMTLALGSRIRLANVDVAIEADPDGLRSSEGEALSGYQRLVGSSPAMRQLYAMLVRLEGSLVNVLVEGESGVGKELVAQSIHAASAVSDGPWIPFNCGAIAGSLLLSELFGHRRGAFTGASDDHEGAFAAAEGGTLFLDEIGELPLEAQPALLRVLESGELRRVGDSKPRRVRTRVIAASNRDLGALVKSGAFREDLYYRLAVVKLTVPPLRERPEDIAVLARRFAHDMGAGDLSDDVFATFEARDWPGNARELRNAVQAYLAIGSLPQGQRVVPQLEHALRAMIDAHLPYAEQKERFVELFAKVYLEMVLGETAGNQSEAARISGLDRSYLGKLVIKLGVRRP
jgi:DNA-binding NtrC family response regulator